MMASSWKELLLIAWAYLVEVVAAVLIYVLLRCAAPETELLVFVNKSSGQWATAFGLAVAVAVGLWCGFFQLLTTEFGEKLRSRKAASVFSSALAFPTFLFVCAAILFMLVPAVNQPLLTHAAAVVGIYSIINLVTLIRNVNRFVRLYQEFGNHKERNGR